jgi:acyl-CoA synthetase (AMP-forming)/AMP-acid ligase II
MTNCMEMPISILGAMAAHAYVAPMNPNYSDRELEPLLKDASPKVIVTLPEFHARVSKFAEKLGHSACACRWRGRQYSRAMG